MMTPATVAGRRLATDMTISLHDEQAFAAFSAVALAIEAEARTPLIEAGDALVEEIEGKRHCPADLTDNERHVIAAWRKACGR